MATMNIAISFNNNNSVDSSVIKENNNLNDLCIKTGIDTNKLNYEDLLEGGKLIDFEEMIDLTREDEAIKTLNNIEEFEKILSSFDPSIKNMDDSIIDLDDFFDKLNTENDDLVTVTLKNESTNIIEISKTENVQTENTPDADVSRYNTEEDSITTHPSPSLKNNYNLRNSYEIDIKQFDASENSLKTKETSVFNQNCNDNSLENHINSPKIIENDFPEHDTNKNAQNLINNDKISEENDNITHTDNLLLKKEIIEIIETDLDVRSVLSNEETQRDEEDGYNSSDFEFITETEANMDGYIINFNKKYSSTPKLDDKSNNNNNLELNEVNNELFDPGEGPSGLNITDDTKNYRENHVIPDGEDYLNLFQSPFNPVMPMMDIIIMENKSVRPSPMHVQYEGMGFDKQLIIRRPPDSSEEEYADEAKENIKMILSMYPGENRKRRRRY